MQPRMLSDGTLMLPRKDANLEKKLDAVYARITPGELRWHAALKQRGENSISSIRALKNTLTGKKAWLFGKGPSFEKFNLKRAGKLRFCINHTVNIVPRPMFFFFMDTGNLLLEPPKGCAIVTCRDKSSLIVAPNKLYTFDWKTDVPEGYCTAAIAIFTLGVLGVEEVVMVGFDAYDYSAGEMEKTPAYPKVFADMGCKRANSDYAKINREIDDAFSKSGIKKIIWSHRKGWRGKRSLEKNAG